MNLAYFYYKNKIIFSVYYAENDTNENKDVEQ